MRLIRIITQHAAEVLPLLGVVLLPLYGCLIPGLSVLHYSYVKYSVLGMFMLLITQQLRKPLWRFNSRYLLLFLVVCACISVSLFAKGSMDGLLAGRLKKAVADVIQKSSGPVIGALTVIYLCRCRAFCTRFEFIEAIAACLAGFLLLQTGVSVFESLRKAPLAHYEMQNEGMEGTEVQGRDLLAAAIGSQGSLLGSRMPFPGMLGQHNMFGIMLMGYNVFFLVLYQATRRRWLLLALCLVLFALVGNSTRTALLSTLFQDFVMLCFLVKHTALRITLVAGGLLLSVLLFSKVIDQGFAGSFAGNLQIRTELWKGLWALYYPPETAGQFLFGLDFESLGRVRQRLRPDSPGGSVENQFFEVYFRAGMLGILLYFTLLVSIVASGFRRSRFGYPVPLVLLGLSLAYISIFMDGVLLFFSSFLIALALISASHYNACQELPHAIWRGGLMQPLLRHRLTNRLHQQAITRHARRCFVARRSLPTHPNRQVRDWLPRKKRRIS